MQKFFEFTAHEVREKLAKLGLKSLEDAIGDTSLMILKKEYKDESVKLGFDRLLDRYRPNKKQSNELKKNLINNSLSDESLNNLITKKLKTNLAKGKGGSFNFEIKNTQRSVGARLARYSRKIWQGRVPRKNNFEFLKEMLDKALVVGIQKALN